MSALNTPSSAPEDLRMYLAQISESLRWQKRNQNRAVGIIASLLLLMLGFPKEPPIHESLQIASAFFVLMVFILLLGFVYPRDRKKWRTREALIIARLSPDLQAIVCLGEKPEYDDPIQRNRSLESALLKQREDAKSGWNITDYVFLVISFIPVVTLFILNTQPFFAAVKRSVTQTAYALHISLNLL